MTARSRKTHLVGAWPGKSAPAAMEAAIARLGPHLMRMSDGETGQRDQWVTPPLEWLRANPDVELVREGDYRDYEHAPVFRLRKGQKLNPENLHLQYQMYFRESYPAFKVLRERHGEPELKFQVGVPAPIDLAVDTFGYEAAMADPSITEAWAAATRREVNAIHKTAGADVVFQVESVVAMVAVATSPADVQEAVAGQMAASLAAVPGDAPVGAHFGVHICLGDFHHRALAEMGNARPLVLLTNALAEAWPADRPLDYIHAPFAAADKPGTLAEEWYEPLSELRLPEPVRFVAGFIHESLDLGDLRQIRDRIDGLTGREVDVASTCGLGRRPDPDEAWDAMEKAKALIEN